MVFINKNHRLPFKRTKMLMNLFSRSGSIRKGNEPSLQYILDS